MRRRVNLYTLNCAPDSDLLLERLVFAIEKIASLRRLQSGSCNFNKPHALVVDLGLIF